MAPRQADDGVAGATLKPGFNPATRTILARNGKVFTHSQVYQHISKHAVANNGRAAWELIKTVVPWLALLAAPLPTTWVLPLLSLFTVRLFVVGVHDTGHGALFSSRRVNNVVGTIVGALMSQPFTYWRTGHENHHEHSNDLDYPQLAQSAPLTVKHYAGMAPWQRAAYQAAVCPPVMVGVTAPLTMTIVQPYYVSRVLEAALMFAWWGLLAWCGLFWRLFFGLAIGGAIGVFLFHLQHTFEGAVREHGRDFFANGYEGSSFAQLPGWLRLFTANIEYHHIHHLNAKVPCYRLQACHEAAPEGMWDGIRPITLWEGAASLRLVLWDEARKRLVRFDEL